VAYEEADDRVLIVAEELIVEDDTEPTPDASIDDPAATARFHLTRSQVAQFVQHAIEVVMSGRPACPLCGHPMDPNGHVCPKSNGHHAP
jgi:uncharacterized repeat protein (TIGR03847 family)